MNPSFVRTSGIAATGPILTSPAAEAGKWLRGIVFGTAIRRAGFARGQGSGLWTCRRRVLWIWPSDNLQALDRMKTCEV